MKKAILVNFRPSFEITAKSPIPTSWIGEHMFQIAPARKVPASTNVSISFKNVLSFQNEILILELILEGSFFLEFATLNLND